MTKDARNSLMFTSTTIASELKSETKILPHVEGRNLRRALISRFADFWLLGGLSIFIFAGLTIYEVQPSFYLLLYPVLQIAIEFPHLMGSYKIALSRGPEWIRQHKLPLFVAPALMLALLVALCFMKAESARAGWETLIALSFVVVGWHRARQAYGCMILYSHFDGYRLAPMQKRILSVTLNFTWIAGYVNLMAFPKTFEFFGFAVPKWEVPLWLLQTANAAYSISFFAFLVLVLGLKAVREKQFPSLNFLVPMGALMIWAASALVNFYYFVFLTPTFHSLQHLTCVYGYRPAQVRWRPLAAMTALLIASGYLLVRWLPGHLAPYFALSFVAINIFFLFHHYILDSIIWRTSDKKVVENLLVLNQQPEGTVSYV
jgi:hypothetical protein